MINEEIKTINNIRPEVQRGRLKVVDLQDEISSYILHKSGALALKKTTKVTVTYLLMEHQ